MIISKYIYSFLFLLSSVFIVSAQTDYPILNEIVTDQAQIFSKDQLVGLRDKLTKFESESTNQIVVLTIDNLHEEPIETFAYEVFNKNNLGQIEKDNGLLILFAKQDRKVRIEVGGGLEPYITDAFARRIIETIMIPEFKNEDYYKGIDKATDVVIGLINTSDAREEFRQQIENESKTPWFIKLIFTLFTSIFISLGVYFFYKIYTNFIEIFRGIFIGKLGVAKSILLIISATLSLLMILPFIFMPMAGMVLINEIDTSRFSFLIDNIQFTIIIFISILFGLAIVLALLKILIKGKENFKLSFFNTDAKYYSKTFSSGGSHSISSDSSSSSSSNSSSFSGGGGSSSGGGSSGSW